LLLDAWLGVGSLVDLLFASQAAILGIICLVLVVSSVGCEGDWLAGWLADTWEMEMEMEMS